MAADKLPTIEFPVCGKPWKAKFLSPRYFTRKHGKKCAAITICDDKEIFFRAGEITKETVIHEVFHAHLWEHGAYSLSLTANQMEELCAEMFSKHAEIILATASIILARLGKVP